VRACFLNKNFDLIFSYQSSPITMANAAVAMKKRTGKKLFLYCLDIWPECLKAWDIKEDSLLFKLMHRYSKHIYQSCDRIGITSASFANYLIETNRVDADKITYLPQHAEDGQAIGVAEKSTGELINFAFGGNIGKVQDVECIIRAVHRLADVPDFKVHIYGNGSRLEECTALVKELELENKIHFYGQVSREKLYDEYEKMDAFLLTLKPVGFVGSTIPGKLQEYMSLGKPIIAAIEGAAAQVMTAADCGLIGAASDDAALAENMHKFILNPDAYRHLGENAYVYYQHHFSKESFMSELDKNISALGL
jgi:glycosyltransferase involved in cell wall biosynthesis